MTAPERVKILLVDDRPANLEALGSCLDGPDYRLVKAGSGEEALGFLLKDTCALILMDVSMPQMDGYETARLIRRNPRTRDIPIVFITAQHPDERHLLAGYQSGAVDYVFKPYHPEVLRSKVAAFAALHRARVQLVRQAERLREHERREHAHALMELELNSLRRQEIAQRRYRTLVEGISHAVMWVLDPATLVCTFVSPSAALLGFEVERWTLDRTFWLDRLHPEDRERFIAGVRSLAVGGEGRTLEHRMTRADGNVAWWRSAVRLLADEETGACELRGFSVDVSEAVQGQEALELLVRVYGELSRSLDHREAAARAASAAVGPLADWCAIELGRDGAHAPVGAAHASPELVEDVRRVATRALESGLRGANETSAVDARSLLDGAEGEAAESVARLATASIVAVPLFGRAGRLGSAVLGLASGRRFGPRERALVELLGRRAALAIDNALLYEKAQGAVLAREEFLSVASHELRTPLTALLLQIRMLEQMVTTGRIAVAPASRPELVRRVAGAAAQVDRLVTLVNSMLDLARIRSGRMVLDLSRCDLADVLRDVRARFEDVLARDGRALHLDAADGLVGRWDRTRVEQLVTNLVGNAVKYGGHGPVRVTAARAGSSAVLTVADGGPGIAPEEQARIFDPFEQGGQRPRASGGLGLGLYIAQNIARAHGGRILLDSAPGRGATFSVELPLEARREDAAAAAGAA